MEELQPREPVRRDSRTIRNASSSGRLRPVLIGVAVVAVVGAAIAAGGHFARMGSVSDPAALVSPGAMNVEETEVLASGRPPKPEADARGTGPIPVRFYEVLEKGRQDAPVGGGEIALRSMPLPPPRDVDGGSARKVVPEPERKTAQLAAPDIGQGIEENTLPPTQAPAPEPPAPAARTTPPAPQAPAVKASAPEAAPAGEAAEAPTKARPYSLQVGSFSRKDGAEELMRRLKDKGHEAYLAQVDLGKKGVWYRVRVGAYPTEHAAKWARLDLVREGLSPIVVHDAKGP